MVRENGLTCARDGRRQRKVPLFHFSAAKSSEAAFNFLSPFPRLLAFIPPDSLSLAIVRQIKDAPIMELEFNSPTSPKWRRRRGRRQKKRRRGNHSVMVMGIGANAYTGLPG